MRTGLAVLAAVIFAGPVAAADFEAGAAAVDVTPPTGYPMWGYSARKDKPAEGVRDPLKARALVLKSGSEVGTKAGL